MHANELNIGNYAQPCLATISPKASAEIALSIMQKMGTHDLPVQQGKRVIGLISDNRLRTALALKTKTDFLVSDLMIKKPTVVSPETSLYEVLDETPNRVGGVTVVQNSFGEVTGVFTPCDAVLTFQKLLHGNRCRPFVAVA